MLRIARSLWKVNRRSPIVPDDLMILDSGIEYTDDGILDYYWFEILERLPDGAEIHYFKVVKLVMLRFIPRQAREQYTILERMRKIILGLTNANVDLIYLVAGMFKPKHIGIVQCYGVQAKAGSVESARKEAEQAMAALKAGLANFEQSRFEPLDTEKAEWIRQSFQKMPYALAVVGHPDPREAPRGMTADGMGGRQVERESIQQNEMLFRGMAKLRENFLNIVMVSRVDPGDRGVYSLQERIARAYSLFQSRVHSTRGVNVGVSLPVMLSAVLGQGAGTSYSTGEGTTVSDGIGEAVARAHTDGWAHSRSRSVAHSEGETWSTAVVEGQSKTTTVGQAHTLGVADGTFRGRSEGWGTADGTFWSHADVHSWGNASGSTWSTVTSTAVTHSESQNSGWEVGGSGGIYGGIGVLGAKVGASGSHSWGTTQGTATTTTTTTSHGGFNSRFESWGTVDSHGGSHTEMHSWGVNSGVSHVDSSADTQSLAVARSSFRSVAQAKGGFRGVTRAVGEVKTVSGADTVAHSQSRFHGLSRSVGLARAQALSVSQLNAAAIGIVPYVSISQTWQTVDQVAGEVARALEDQLNILRTIGKEGGCYVDNYFLAETPEGRRALQSLVYTAFHGLEDVATKVVVRRLTPEEEAYIRKHAFAFVPSRRPEPSPWALEAYRDSSLLTMLQAATYVTPGMFEEGTAVTVAERMPPWAFVPDLKGDALLGHIWSPETNEITPAEVRLPKSRMGHWLIAGDTGSGKTVAAERLILELVREWHVRAVVIDFMSGWRRLMRMLPPDRFDLYGLHPASPRPIRWNPLQLSRYLDPDEQIQGVCEILARTALLGQRQFAHLVNTLTDLYAEHGVMVYDEEIYTTPWGVVRDEKEALVANEVLRAMGLPEVSPGASLRDLPDEAKHRIAVERSKKVDFSKWYSKLLGLLRRLERDSRYRADVDSLTGILARLKRLTRGRWRTMYGEGEGSITIEDLSFPWGLTVIEGDRINDSFLKIFLLDLFAWRYWTDAIAQEPAVTGITERQVDWEKARPPTVLVFEESNLLLGGVPVGKLDSRDKPFTSELFENILRTSRKYNLWVVLLTQSPSQVPKAVISSCSNVLVGKLQEAEDRDAVVPLLGKSEKGFHYIDYVTSTARAPVGLFVLKLGAGGREVWDMEPMLIQPLMVRVEPPTPEEVRARFGLL